MSQSIRPVIFGEVLYDCFPDGRQVLGGAPFNVAWHLQAFGLNPYFISRVGDDAPGRKIKAAMLDWGMDVSGLQLDAVHATGMVAVSIESDEPSYEIVNHRAWDYIDYEINRSGFGGGILYHGSLALRNQTSKTTLAKIKNDLSWPVFIDVNLRSPWWQKDSVLESIADAQIIKLNEHELALLVPEQETLEHRARFLLDHTAIETMIVTRGVEGAVALLDSGECLRVKPAGTVKNLVDTVGAGDAFSSVLLLGLIRQWPWQLSIERAQQFAARIIEVQGATLDDKNFYQSIIASWN